MEFVRLVHPGLHYDFERGKFTNLAFRGNPLNDGRLGVSCFGKTCADESTGSVCAHINRFYRTIATAPAVFWIFDESQLPPGSCVKQETEGGDACHHNVVGASGTAYRRVAPGWTVGELFICDGDGMRPLTADDLEAFRPSRD